MPTNVQPSKNVMSMSLPLTKPWGVFGRNKKRPALRLLVLLLGSVASSSHGAQWDYEGNVDKMTGKITATASMISDNQLNLGFPYQGQNYGQISVRNKPGEGTHILLVIGKGQIVCSSYDCSLRVKFGDAAPVSFSGDHPTDGSSNVVFLSTPQKFISRAKTAKKVLVEFTVYNQGTQILEFSVPGPLAWPPTK